MGLVIIPKEKFNETECDICFIELDANSNGESLTQCNQCGRTDLMPTWFYFSLIPIFWTRIMNSVRKTELTQLIHSKENAY